MYGACGVVLFLLVDFNFIFCVQFVITVIISSHTIPLFLVAVAILL